MRALRYLVVLVLLTVFWPGASTAALQDGNFTENVWVSVNTGSWGVTGIAWAPDGSNRLFWCKQDGTVNIIKNGVALSTPFATMSPLRVGGEEGLIGLAFDPNFVDNGYVYVFATTDFDQSEILRYRAVGDVGVERTLIKGSLPEGGNHNGGGIGFGPDGKLYWGIGETGSNIPRADLASLRSKIGRMNPDGTAPDDNPFYDGNGPNNDFIFARGFRNPYTLTFQPSTEKLWVNVVGTSAEQIFLVNRGDHAGYVQGDADSEGEQVAPYVQPVLNYWEGSGEIVDIASATRSNGVVTVTTDSNHFLYKPGRRVRIAGMPDSSFNTSQPYPPIIDIPSPNQFRFAQAGPNATSAGNGNGYSNITGLGRVVLGGTFYDGTAFPAAYRGNFFWGDFSSGNVMRAVMGGPTENKFETVDVFSTGIDQYIDATGGPDGALYYVTYGGTFYRVAYPTTAQGIILSSQHVRMSEGGHAVITASLATAPTGTVTVNVARQSGDADLTVSGGATLTFGPGNWNVPQAITIASATDADSSEDVATFAATSGGLTTQTFVVKATDANNQALILSTSSLTVDEGSTGSFTVRLARAPASDVTVGVARSAGDGTVTVSGGASLTFTAANYATPQTVTIAAADDVDTTDETATIAVSATGGIAARNVSVTVRDNSFVAPTITSSPRLTAIAGSAYRYQVVATGVPDPAFQLVTGPIGMTINQATGLVSWTPAAAGSASVTVRAQNGFGSPANQSFTIIVAADQPPRAVLTEPSEGQQLAGTQAEFYGDCLDDVACTKADFYVDDVLRYTDTNTFNHFHFNSAHAQFNTRSYTNGPHRLRFTVTDTSGRTGSREVNVVIANPVTQPDAGRTDAGVDAGRTDAGVDAGRTDAGTDAGRADAGVDAGRTDAGTDAGRADAGRTDAGVDAGRTDAGRTDAGRTDASADAGRDGQALADGGETEEDAGETEGETPPVEAGVTPPPSDAPDPTADAAPDAAPTEASGCSCQATPTSNSGGLSLGLAGFILFARRRKTRRRATID